MEGAVTQLQLAKLLSFIIYSLRMGLNLEAPPFSSGVLQKGETQPQSSAGCSLHSFRNPIV